MSTRVIFWIVTFNEADKQFLSAFFPKVKLLNFKNRSRNYEKKSVILYNPQFSAFTLDKTLIAKYGLSFHLDWQWSSRPTKLLLTLMWLWHWALWLLHRAEMLASLPLPYHLYNLVLDVSSITEILLWITMCD